MDPLEILVVCNFHGVCFMAKIVRRSGCVNHYGNVRERKTENKSSVREKMNNTFKN